MSTQNEASTRGMLQRLRQLGSDLLTYGANSMLSQLISFLLLPLYTRELSPMVYGELAMIMILTAIFSPLASQGMKSAVYRDFPRCTEEEPRRRMLGTALISVAAWALFGAGLGFVLAPQIAEYFVGNPDTAAAVRIALLTAGLAAVNEIPTVALQSARRVKTVAVINLGQLLTNILTTILFVVVFKWGLIGVVGGGLCGAVATSIGYFVNARNWFSLRFDRHRWASMAAYGLPFLPHRLFSIVLVYFGDYSVRTMLGLDQAGLYSVAARFATPMAFATGAFYSAWQPYKFQVFQADKDPRPFFRSMLTYTVAAVCYLWLGIALWGPELLRLMTPPAYHSAATLIGAVALMRAVYGIYPMLATGIDVADNTRSVPWASLFGLLVTLAATWTFIPVWGALGAALATTAAAASMGAAFFVISQRQYPIDYDWRTVAALFVSAAMIVLSGAWISSWPNIARLPCLAALSLIYPAAALLIFLTSSTERERVQRSMRRLAQRLSPASSQHHT